MQVRDSSIKMFPAQKPANRDFRAEAKDAIITLLAGPFQVTAQCDVVAEPSDRIPPSAPTNPRFAPWKLGFMQAQILEIQWAYYRGVQPDHGSMLQDNAAGRRLQICRDYDRTLGTIWYEGSANVNDCYGLPDVRQPSPRKLEFYFGDNPRNQFYSVLRNDKTGRPNYLHEARLAMAFVTTLTEQVSEGVYKHHRHFFWSAIWHIQSTTTDPQHDNNHFNVLPGSGFWMSDFKRGEPKNSSYQTVLSDPHLTLSCGEVAERALPVQSSASNWQRFPLMDQKDKLF